MKRRIIRALLESVIFFFLATWFMYSLVSIAPGASTAADVRAGYLHTMKEVGVRLLESDDANPHSLRRQIVARGKASMALVGVALLIVMVVAVPLGVRGSLSKSFGLPQVSEWLVYVVSGIPVLLMGYFLVPFLQNNGFSPLVQQQSEMGSRGGVAGAFLLAAAVLAFGDGVMGDAVRAVRNECERVAIAPFFRAARMRGIGVVPILARRLGIAAAGIMGAKVVPLLGGAVVVEYIFDIQGLGYFTFREALERDVIALVTVVTVFVIVVRSIDLMDKGLSFALDPRVRKGRVD